MQWWVLNWCINVNMFNYTHLYKTFHNAWENVQLVLFTSMALAAFYNGTYDQVIKIFSPMECILF